MAYFKILLEVKKKLMYTVCMGYLKCEQYYKKCRAPPRRNQIKKAIRLLKIACNCQQEKARFKRNKKKSYRFKNVKRDIYKRVYAKKTKRRLKCLFFKIL